MTDIIPHKQFSFDNIKSVTYHITPQYSMPVSDFSVPFYWSTPYPPPPPLTSRQGLEKSINFLKAFTKNPRLQCVPTLTHQIQSRMCS